MIPGASISLFTCQILTLEQDLEKTQGRYSAASRELQGQCDLVGALEKELERTGAAQKEAAHEVRPRAV